MRDGKVAYNYSHILSLLFDRSLHLSFFHFQFCYVRLFFLCLFFIFLLLCHFFMQILEIIVILTDKFENEKMLLYVQEVVTYMHSNLLYKMGTITWTYSIYFRSYLLMLPPPSQPIPPVCPCLHISFFPHINIKNWVWMSAHLNIFTQLRFISRSLIAGLDHSSTPT